MQVPVPKDIDLEDKIIGPMTLRQFLYVLVGGTIAYTVFQKIGGPQGNNQLAIMLAIPIALFSLALAFMKIQGRPLGDFLVSTLIFFIRPRQRIWRKHDAQQGIIMDESKKPKEQKITKQPINVKELSDLTKILDADNEEDNKVT
ncbi:MAG: PrgI family protein [bacterium]|nr:PrgI family protein [bacterium]